MRFEVKRHGITVIPDCEEDTAYIEDTLGLKNDGDAILLRRENAHGLSCIAYLSTHWYPRDRKTRLVGDSVMLIETVLQGLEPNDPLDVDDDTSIKMVTAVQRLEDVRIAARNAGVEQDLNELQETILNWMEASTENDA